MNDKNLIGLKDAVAIGVGGMVGGGIFAVLGLAVEFAHGGTAFAFLMAGIIALLTAYSYVHLSLRFPDKGGTVHYINQGFGKNVFSGGTNNLLWISYIIMLCLYAVAFGSYGAKLIHITGSYATDQHILLSSIILFAALLNYISFKVVSVTESIAVLIKILILGAFVVLGIYGLSNSPYVFQLGISSWSAPFKLISGGMIIFVAYEGFELIANAVPNIRNPKKNVAKAFYISVIGVVALYMLIAIITVGSVSFLQIGQAQEYVLAVAAEPILGTLGFTIIGITALISTFSAINSTLYGGSRVSYKLGIDDEAPHEFTNIFWNRPIGLLIAIVLTLLIANTINLESIATAGSAGFLLIFAIVNYANYKLAAQTKSKKIIPLLGGILCVIAVITLMVQQIITNIMGASIVIIIIAAAYLAEYFFKRSQKTEKLAL